MMTEDVKKTIEDALEGATCYVLDPNNDGEHLQAIVISPAFEGKMLVEQHRMVMEPLKQALKESLHALGLKTFTPKKWNEVKDQYNF